MPILNATTEILRSRAIGCSVPLRTARAGRGNTCRASARKLTRAISINASPTPQNRSPKLTRCKAQARARRVRKRLTRLTDQRGGYARCDELMWQWGAPMATVSDNRNNVSFAHSVMQGSCRMQQPLLRKACSLCRVRAQPNSGRGARVDHDRVGSLSKHATM